MTSDKQRVLAILTKRDVELPDDGLTREMIRDRGTRFRVEADEFLAFRLERHPTMYLSDSQFGRHQSPARFHVVTEYRLELDDETWRVDEVDATFAFDSHLVIEAELDALGRKHAIEEQLEAVKTAENPNGAFDEAFDSWIDHWEDKFAEIMAGWFPTTNGKRSSDCWWMSRAQEPVSTETPFASGDGGGQPPFASTVRKRNGRMLSVPSDEIHERCRWATPRGLGSDQSRLTFVADVRPVYNWLTDEGYLAFNPLDGVESEYGWERPDADNQSLRATDVQQLLATAETPAEELLVTALPGWGLRPSEVAQLHVSQFALEGDDPHIAFEERKNGPGTVAIHYGVHTVSDRIDQLADRDDWGGYLFPCWPRPRTRPLRYNHEPIQATC